MVGGLTPQARPVTRVNGHLCPNCRGRTHPSTALFPFAQANTYRERLSIKGLWGEGRGSVQGKVSASKGWASALLLQSTQACPGLLGVGSDGWGVKDSQWVGRHKRHVLRDRKPVTVAAATMSRVYCVVRHLAQRRASALHAGKQASDPASTRLESPVLDKKNQTLNEEDCSPQENKISLSRLS